MSTTATSLRSDSTTIAPQAATGLAIVRVTIGAMLVWVFSKIWGRTLSTGRLRGPDQLLHQGESVPGCVEGCYGLAASHASLLLPCRA
jgi:hypothetical protein